MTPSGPKHREAFTDAQRVALRQQHREWPLQTQKELCEWFENKFGKPINQTSVSKVLSKRYIHLDSLGEGAGTDRKRQRRPQFEELEAALAQWHIQEQYRLPITGDLLKIKASWFWRRLPQYRDQPEPQFSDGWLTRFKQRHGIRDRRRHGEAASVDEQAHMAELLLLQSRLATYSPEDQYNCDETGLFWKALPERSLTTSRIAGTKQDKARITVHCCINASGSHKLKPWVVGRHKSPRCFTAAKIDIKRFNCVYRFNSKSWMTGMIMVEWLRWFDRQMAGRKVVLVMDNFSAHQSAVDELAALPAEYGLVNTEVLWLPPNTTSKTQPLDQGIIATFKALYRKQWLRFMLEEVEFGRLPMKTMNLLHAIRFTINAWSDVSPQTIANCWNHSGLRIDRPSSRPLLSQTTEAIAELEQQLTEGHNRGVLPTRMSISAILNDPDELVDDTEQDVAEMIAAQYEPPPEEESDEEEQELPRISGLQALQSLQLLRLFEEQSNDCNFDWLRSLNRYESVVRQRKAVTERQGRLTSWLQDRATTPSGAPEGSIPTTWLLDEQF